MKQQIMKTATQHQPWGVRSLSYWITLLLALGIILIGARFILDPYTGATGFGIPFTHSHDALYGKIKGIRDMFSGLVLLPLLYMRMRKATAWVFTTTIIVPAFDCLLILFTNGPGDVPHLLIHGLTALIMVVNSVLLFSGLPKTGDGK